MRCGPFPQDFGQIHAKITLHFIKIKRACFIFACVIVLVFFQNQTRLGRVFKLEKKKVNSN